MGTLCFQVVTTAHYILSDLYASDDLDDQPDTEDETDDEDSNSEVSEQVHSISSSSISFCLLFAAFLIPNRCILCGAHGSSG